MKVYTTVYLNYKFLGFHTYALNEENSEDLSNVFKDGKMIYFTRTWLRRYDHLVKKMKTYWFEDVNKVIEHFK
jgi:hypothetical protein